MEPSSTAGGWVAFMHDPQGVGVTAAAAGCFLLWVCHTASARALLCAPHLTASDRCAWDAAC